MPRDWNRAWRLLGDLNGGFENPYQMQMWFEYGGGIELAREIYKRFNTYYVGPVWWGVESVPAKKPLRTLADFKGVKMRVPEGLGAEIWRRAGVGVVTLPGSEVYTALERGVIEATDWGTLGMNNDLGYHKIAKYPLSSGLPFDAVRGGRGEHGQVECAVAGSQGAHGGCRPRLRARHGPAHRAGGHEGGRAGQGGGLRARHWSPEERLKFRQLAEQSWADWAKKSPTAKKVYDSQIAFLKKLQLL